MDDASGKPPKPPAPKKGTSAQPKEKGRNGDLGDRDQRLLWGRAAGRCQRCNIDVSRDRLSWRAYNLSENAHIIASSVNGTRGAKGKSAALADKLENHLLLCRDCHKIVDEKRRGEVLFPTEWLLKLKHDQEALVHRLMELAKKPQSVAVYISAAVGQTRLQPLVIDDINMAIVDAGLVPALNHPIHIDLLTLLEVETLDSDPAFWAMASKLIRRKLEAELLEGAHKKLSEVEHFSLFGLAPIPVLALLGNLIPDTRKAMMYQPIWDEINPGRKPLGTTIDIDIHQYDRDPETWCWPKERRQPVPVFSYVHMAGPAQQRGGDIAVLCELSFPTHLELVEAALPGAPVYHFTASDVTADIIQAPTDVKAFMAAFRQLLSVLERDHGHNAHVHVFGSLPVSCAIALGRLQVKGSLSMTVHNLQRNPNRYTRGLTLPFEV